MPDKEIKEAKSLRWLANQFPKVENPKDNGDRLCNCINLYCTNAAELIEQQAAEIERLKTKFDFAKSENEELKSVINGFRSYEEEIKSEAVKEFAQKVIEKVEKARQKYQRLCKEQGEKENEAMNIIFRGMINIVKEMVGGDNA